MVRVRARVRARVRVRARARVKVRVRVRVRVRVGWPYSERLRGLCKGDDPVAVRVEVGEELADLQVW